MTQRIVILVGPRRCGLTTILKQAEANFNHNVHWLTPTQRGTRFRGRPKTLLVDNAEHIANFPANMRFYQTVIMTCNSMRFALAVANAKVIRVQPGINYALHL